MERNKYARNPFLMNSVFKFIIFLTLIIFTTSSTTTLAKRAAIIIDFDTKEVLFEINADTLNYPASLVKIMTLYILFDYLDKNKIQMKTKMNEEVHEL